MMVIMTMQLIVDLTLMCTIWPVHYKNNRNINRLTTNITACHVHRLAEFRNVSLEPSLVCYIKGPYDLSKLAYNIAYL